MFFFLVPYFHVVRSIHVALGTVEIFRSGIQRERVNNSIDRLPKKQQSRGGSPCEETVADQPWGAMWIGGQGLQFISTIRVSMPLCVLGEPQVLPSSLSAHCHTCAGPLSSSSRKASAAAWSCLNLCNPMDYRPPGSSVHRISQARILEWVAISFSRGSSRPRK